MSTNHHLLSEPQRRSISITLADIERRLLRLRDELHHAPTQGVLARYSEPLPNHRAAQIDKLITTFQQKIQRLAAELALEPKDEPQLRSILVELVLADVAIEEIKPRYLCGYGEVDVATATYLDTALPEFQILLTELTALLNTKGFVARTGLSHSDDSRA